MICGLVVCPPWLGDVRNAAYAVSDAFARRSRMLKMSLEYVGNGSKIPHDIQTTSLKENGCQITQQC